MVYMIQNRTSAGEDDQSRPNDPTWGASQQLSAKLPDLRKLLQGIVLRAPELRAKGRTVVSIEDVASTSWLRHSL